MATTCILRVEGRIFASPSAYTMTVNGEQVHSGPVQSNLPLGSDITLLTIPNVTFPGNLSASITVTTGKMTLGPISVLGNVSMPFASLDLRTNVKIDNANPPWPSDGGPTLPEGTPQDPNWTGWWFYQLGQGDTASFNIVVPENARGGLVNFVNQPTSVTTGSSTTFSLNIPVPGPIPFPKTATWRVVNGTTSDSDFEAVTGNVVFATANSSLTINTVAQASPNPAKTFGVELLTPTGNIAGQSTIMNLV